MRTTEPDALASKLTTEAAFRRIEVLSVWERLAAAWPGLAQFELGDDPETEIRRNVSILAEHAERDLSADVAGWLRESGPDRAAALQRAKDVLARTRALREAREGLFDITANAARAANLIERGPQPFFDIVNRALARVGEAV